MARLAEEIIPLRSGKMRTLVDPYLLKYVLEYLMVQLICRVVFDLNDVILLYLNSTLVYSTVYQRREHSFIVYKYGKLNKDQGPQLHYAVIQSRGSIIFMLWQVCI